MPIIEANIKLYASKRMTDTDDGGGPVTGNQILDGASNAMFPDIAELDRALGKVSIRQVFPAIATDDTEAAYGAHVIVADGPDDPRVHCTIFSAEDWTAERTALVDRLESYLGRGPLFSGIVYDQHITGQKSLLVLMSLTDEAPAVGQTLCIVKLPGQVGEQTQYIRITDVAVQTRSFDLSPCGTKQFQVVTLGLSDPLAWDITGGQPWCAFSHPQGVKLYETIVVDANRYYGIQPLAVAASTGDARVTVESIYSTLVPSAQTSIPISDARPFSEIAAVMPVGTATATVSTSASLSPSASIYLGQGFMPGSLTLTCSAYVLTDLGGKLMNGTTAMGTVDYAAGRLDVDVGGPTIGGTKSIAFRPAAAPSRTAQTLAIEVTAETRSAAVVTFLDPVPAPGTLAIHYMAQGNWYVIRDNGAGQIVGTDASYGAGTLGYTSGALNCTLGALPDVGSQVILAYAVPTLDQVRDGATIQAYQDITPAGAAALIPGAVTVTWGGDKTATDDGAGSLIGDASGTVDYAARTIRFLPAVLPAVGAMLDVAVAETSTPHAENVAITAAGGRLQFTLGPVRARSVRFTLEMDKYITY